jgi:hypothetical protein
MQKAPKNETMFGMFLGSELAIVVQKYEPLYDIFLTHNDVITKHPYTK